MKINKKKLEIAMAKACMTAKTLSEKSDVSQFTITRIQTKADVLPATVVTEIIEAEE